MNKKYDMHIHLWQGAGESAGLIQRLEQSGIFGGAVFSEPPAEMNMGDKPAGGKERLERVLAFTRDYPERLFPVLWVHPDEAGLCSLIKASAERGIRGFKVICNNFYVYEKKSLDMLTAIAETALPVCFHSGILWDPGVSGEYNRPLHWEALMEIPGIRFSLAHCGWPWYDECIALYSKFLYLANQKNFSAEMYLDLTPGTPMPYRRDLLTKLITSGFDVDHHMMFGTDCNALDYRVEWAQKWLAADAGIFDDLGVGAEVRDRIFSGNMLRFFGISGDTYRYRAANSDGS
jgi:predicted TIM-barrel fold metal-dependent hydrolase